jgi:virginiamycin B lyase
MNNDNKIYKKKRNYLLIVSIIISISIVSVIIISSFIIVYSNTNINNNDNNNNNETSSYNENTDDEFSKRGSINTNTNTTTSNPTAEVEGKQIPTKYVPHLCGSSFEKISEFIVEYSIPFPCSQPVGITIDETNRAWIAATWPGYLLVFDPKINYFSDFIEIPNWKTKGIFGSMVWGMEFDKNGDLWFTDQENNAIWRYYIDEKKFEMYKIPTRGAYPASIEFDSEGNIWFSEIFGKKLASLNPSLAENNTSKGIREYEFEDLVNHKLTTMGPVSINNNNNNNNKTNNNANTDKDIVWFSAVHYPYNGSIVKYNITSKKFDVFPLTKDAGIPISIIEDDKQNLWINDHATSLFFEFNPKNSQIKKYTTSLPSTRVNTSSLPYFNEYREGKIWFNIHEGNAIGYLDPEDNTLVEYHIPTRSKIWGNTSNPLKFAIDNKGSVYFTEWTENKIGILNSTGIGKMPIRMNVSKNVIELNSAENKGDTIDISLYNNNQINNNNNETNLTKLNGNSKQEKLDDKIKMLVSSSISRSGILWNITGNFSKDEISMSDVHSNRPYNLTLEIKPTENVVPGNYTLTISARYENSITYSKIVDMVIR